MRVVLTTFSTFFLLFSQMVLANVLTNGGLDGQLTVSTITLEGNKMTRDNIVMRELEFFVGTSYLPSQLDSLIVKSRQNLMNRSLFNFVTITKIIDRELCDIRISMIERWYIWPIPIIQFADRNLNAWIEKNDLKRLNYGIDLRVENFRGRMEKLNFVLQTGYDMVFAGHWTVPYLDKNQVTGLSLKGGVRFNHEVPYRTVNNKPVYYRSPDAYARDYIFGGINFTFRPKYNYLHDVGFSFSSYVFQDTLLKLNPDFSIGTTSQYFSLTYTFKLDFRDYKPYPLNGYYFDVQIQKMGLGLFPKGIDILWVGTTFDHYFPLISRWYFAYNFSTRLSGNKNRPYFLSSGLGYNDLNVRGYDLYVIDGQNMGLIKSNLKFELIPQKTYQINWIKSKKFSEIFLALYANVFFDMGYVSDYQYFQQNSLANQLIWGTGLGLDFVTYYDVVIRLEAAMNKQKKSGFFISFVAPI